MTESKFAHFSDTVDFKHNYLQHNYSKTMAVSQRENTGGQHICELKHHGTPKGYDLYFTP